MHQPPHAGRASVREDVQRCYGEPQHAHERPGDVVEFKRYGALNRELPAPLASFEPVDDVEYQPGGEPNTRTSTNRPQVTSP